MPNFSLILSEAAPGYPDHAAVGLDDGEPS